MLKTYKTIDLRGKRRVDAGAFSAYFRLNSERGVKVFGMGDDYGTDGYATKRDLIAYGMGDAWHEFRAYDELRGKRIVCKAYAVVAVRTSSGWYPGLILQHAKGKQLWECVKSSERFQELLAKADVAFYNAAGFEHPDLHGGNVIYNGKTFKVLDFA